VNIYHKLLFVASISFLTLLNCNWDAIICGDNLLQICHRSVETILIFIIILYKIRENNPVWNWGCDSIDICSKYAYNVSFPAISKSSSSTTWHCSILEGFWRLFMISLTFGRTDCHCWLLSASQDTAIYRYSICSVFLFCAILYCLRVSWPYNIFATLA
jgi:hypothetical protein